MDMCVMQACGCTLRARATVSCKKMCHAGPVAQVVVSNRERVSAPMCPPRSPNFWLDRGN